ncbi:MAG: ADP-ribosylglycohydrolase family protein [Candidatus Rifleibacteriota bacterium]
MNKEDFEKIMDRAKASILGQVSGDSLGGLVEFMSPLKIKQLYPDGLKLMQNGGTWSTIAGQPTDDSEMALALLNTLIEKKKFDVEAARQAYLNWLDSSPFDCGITVATGLNGAPDFGSQANGALMRVCPIGIAGAKIESGQVAEWAIKDAELTHPNPVCLQTNALMAKAIADCIALGTGPEETHNKMYSWAKELKADDKIIEILDLATQSPPEDYIENQDWVLLSFHNALWHLLNTKDPAEAISQTIMQGGDTDTNAAICGCLLGAVHGREKFPKQWEESILSCKPLKDGPGVYRPRPEAFWPVNIFNQVEKLLSEDI